MWLVTFFDLPTETRQNKTDYRRFREFLLSDGYIMLQFSVYARPCPNLEAAEKHESRLELKLPPEGQVRMLKLTTLQYGRMKCFFGENTGDPEKPPDQLTIF